MKRTFAAVAMLMACAVATPAWVQTAPTPVSAYGTVKTVSTDQIVVAQPSGADVTVKLRPDVKVLLSTTISVDQIKPGSYLGTTNLAKPDNTGRSLEVHVSPPGQVGPGVDYVMDANTGAYMTNGVVSTVDHSAGGQVLAVNHGKGVRMITVPANIPIVLNSPSDLSQVKVGAKVKVATFTRKDGSSVQYMMFGEGVTP